MSASEYFISKGFSPKQKSRAVDEGAAVAVWTPQTSTRVAITDLTISAGSAGTIAFYWGNVNGDKIAEFLVAGSVSLTPAIGCWEGTAYDRSLFAVAVLGATDNFRINLTGFELT